MPYTVEETRERLKRPDGPARIDLAQAWDSLIVLSLAQDPAALSAVVRAAKEKSYREKAAALFSPDVCEKLLSSADPKTRKNTARLIGLIGRQEDAGLLMAALEKETVRMVRPSMLLAIGAAGGEEAARFVSAYQVPPPSDETEEKHVREEEKALSAARARLLQAERYAVRGIPKGLAIELVVCDGLEEAVISELRTEGIEAVQVAPGRLKSTLSSYRALLKVRVWRELLFPLLTVTAEPEHWAKAVSERCGKRFLHLLEQIYEGEASYPYRIEIRADFEKLGSERHTKPTRAGMIADLAAGLEAAAGPGKLVNNPSAYDTELRLEAHGQTLAVYMKLCTLQDHRFAYRKETVAASIHPSAAAGVMAFAAPYLKPGAVVYDPCCGSGTMLIERAAYDEISGLYGTDLSQEAIDKAKINLQAAHLRVPGRLIRKNCLAFQPKGKVDEVISNLPFGIRTGDHETNEALYEGIFQRLPVWLNRDGVAVFYTMEVRLIDQLLKRHQKELKLLGHVRTASGGLQPGIYIIGMKHDERKKAKTETRGI